MKVLDCHMSYGASVDGTPYKNCDTFEELCDSLDTAGISGGLLRCSHCSTGGVQYGCEEVTRDIHSERGKQYRFWSVWPILPECTNELPSPAELPEVMAKNGVGALYLDGNLRYVVNKISIGSYLEMAQERKIPVFLHRSFGLTMEKIGEILEWYPKLTAIVGDTDMWPNGRRLYPLFYAYENAYIDLYNVTDEGGLEDMTRRFGSDRILLGTGFPDLYQGSQMARVRGAMIPEADKEKILGENLERLIAQEVLG